MTFDDELTLIEIMFTENEMGDSIEHEERTIVLCGVKSVTRSEHYAAAANDIVPSIVFIINKYDYNKQSKVEFEGNKYRVIRTYAQDKAKELSDFETIELICEGGDNFGDA